MKSVFDFIVETAEQIRTRRLREAEQREIGQLTTEETQLWADIELLEAIEKRVLALSTELLARWKVVNAERRRQELGAAYPPPAGGPQ